MSDQLSFLYKVAKLTIDADCVIRWRRYCVMMCDCVWGYVDGWVCVCGWVCVGVVSRIKSPHRNDLKLNGSTVLDTVSIMNIGD